MRRSLATIPTQFSAAFGRGLLGRMTKDGSKGTRRVRGDPSRTGEGRAGAAELWTASFCILALIDAGLGRKEEALRESRRAVELVPVEKDSINGADMIHYSAIVAAWVGDKELALQDLAKVAQLPGQMTYGRLKLLPWYDPLRGDPRFEKIVNSLAPKAVEAAACHAIAHAKAGVGCGSAHFCRLHACHHSRELLLILHRSCSRRR